MHANQQLASLAVAVCLYHSRFLRLDSQSPTKRPPSLHQCLLFFASFSSVSVCWSVFLIFAALVGGCCSFFFCLLSPLPFAHSVQLEGCHPFFSTEVIVYQDCFCLRSSVFGFTWFHLYSGQSSPESPRKRTHLALSVQRLLSTATNVRVVIILRRGSFPFSFPTNWQLRRRLQFFSFLLANSFFHCRSSRIVSDH